MYDCFLYYDFCAKYFDCLYIFLIFIYISIYTNIFTKKTNIFHFLIVYRDCKKARIKIGKKFQKFKSFFRKKKDITQDPAISFIFLNLRMCDFIIKIAINKIVEKICFIKFKSSIVKKVQALRFFQKLF